MDFVDLQRRRKEERARQKPKTPPRSIVRDPLFLVGTGFVLGFAASDLFLAFFYTGDPYTLFFFHPLMLFVAVVALLCYAGWLLLRGEPESIRPTVGAEKQLLMAIQDSGGGITPVEAALETSLTVDEAEAILTRFADRGHLVVQSQDGALLYTLPGRRPTPEPRTI